MNRRLLRHVDRNVGQLDGLLLGDLDFDRRRILFGYRHIDIRQVNRRLLRHVDRNIRQVNRRLLGHVDADIRQFDRCRLGYVDRNIGQFDRRCLGHVHVDRRGVGLGYAHDDFLFGELDVHGRRLNRRHLDFDARRYGPSFDHTQRLFFLRRFRPTPSDAYVKQEYDERNRTYVQRNPVEIVGRHCGVVLENGLEHAGFVHDEVAHAAPNQTVNERERRQEHRENGAALKASAADAAHAVGTVFPFDAVFIRTERVSCHGDEAKPDEGFRQRGEQAHHVRQKYVPLTCVYDFGNTARDDVEVGFREKVTDCTNRRDLQNIAHERNDSSVRSLDFTYALFVVDVERADFTAQKTAEDMYRNAEDCHEERGNRKLRLKANHVRDELHCYDPDQRRGKNLTECFHGADVRIQSVDAAYLFLEQIFQMGKRSEDVDAQHQQHKRVQRCRDQFHRVGNRGIIERKQRLVKHENSTGIPFRNNQGSAYQRRQRNRRKQVEHADEFRSGTGLVDPPTNKGTLFRRNHFEFVLFHLSLTSEGFCRIFLPTVSPVFTPPRPNRARVQPHNIIIPIYYTFFCVKCQYHFRKKSVKIEKKCIYFKRRGENSPRLPFLSAVYRAIAISPRRPLCIF